MQRAILLAGVVLALVLFDRLLDSPGRSLQFNPRSVLILIGVLAVSVGLSLLIWSRLVQLVTGSPPSLRGSIVGLGALMIGKYIPGKVFGLIGRLSSVHAAVPASRATGLVLLEQIVLVCGMAVVAVPVLALRTRDSLDSAWPAALLFVGGAVAALILLRLVRKRWPAIAAVFSNAARKKSIARAIAGVLLIAVAQALMVAAPVIPVAEMIGVRFGFEQGLWLIGAYAGSIFLGMIAFVLPGGIGAREAAFVWLSAPLLDPETGLALAAALRLTNVVFDFVIGAFGALLARNRPAGGSG